MPTQVKNQVVKNIGTNPTIICQTDNTIKITIIGISLTNLIDRINYIDITLEDNGVTTYYLKNTVVPFNSSLRAVSTGEKLILNYNNILRVSAIHEESIDAIVSYAEIIE